MTSAMAAPTFALSAPVETVSTWVVAMERAFPAKNAASLKTLKPVARTGLVLKSHSGGRGSRNRTYNLRFWRPTLCQLSYTPPKLLHDLGDDAGTHGLATFTDGETQAFFHGDRVDQLDRDRHVVAGHDHFLVLGQLDRAGHVRRAEVELRAVVVEERRVAAAFVLGQDIDLGREVRVRLHRTGLAQHLA